MSRTARQRSCPPGLPPSCLPVIPGPSATVLLGETCSLQGERRAPRPKGSSCQERSKKGKETHRTREPGLGLRQASQGHWGWD